MSGETWARVSLRIVGQRLTTEEIGRLMGKSSSAKPGHPWAIDLTEDSAIDLNEQIQIAKDYLRGKANVLEDMIDSEVSLNIGWTPRSPQDGVLLDAEMTALLSRTRCSVLLDTYLD